MILPKRFDIFLPDWGMLRKGLDAFRLFFKLYNIIGSKCSQVRSLCVFAFVSVSLPND